MQITNVRVKLNRDSWSKVKAFCKVTFDDVFVVDNIVVIKDDHREDYYFINYPNKLLRTNERLFIAHPIQGEFGKYVENVVLDEFEKCLNEAYDSELEGICQSI